jgi:hypothetical protein
LELFTSVLNHFAEAGLAQGQGFGEGALIGVLSSQSPMELGQTAPTFPAGATLSAGWLMSSIALRRPYTMLSESRP